MALITRPQIFLALSVCCAAISPISLHIWLVASVVLLIISFRPKVATVLVILLISSHYFANNTAFILDTQYSTKNITYITTKGYLKNINADRPLNHGDLLVGEFTPIVTFGKLPRLKYEMVDNITYRAVRVPIISSILNLRISHTATLLNRSGGGITTTPAHIFAVRKNISSKHEDEYIITGLSHLLAMSGFHVAIFTGGFFVLLTFIPARLRVIPAIILLPLLIPLSGFAVTVVRSAVFAMVYLFAVSADLKVNGLKFLAMLGGLFLVFSPFSLFSISFLLSFFAVFGIMVLMNKKYGVLKDIAYIGVASTIFTLPLQLYFFWHV